MSEVYFLAFCITVVALVAIANGKDKVALKALSMLGGSLKNIPTIISKVLGKRK